MLRFTDISLHRGGRAIFAGLTFALHAGWKCGVTGANGAGKSTLFALVRGALHADGGHIGLPPGWVIAHVAQESVATDRTAIDHVLDGDAELRAVEKALEQAQSAGDGLAEATLHAKLDSIDAWTARTRAARLLNGLGFSPADETRAVSEFSGGWRMRLSLAQALMCRSDLLLLDEPTNHLDLDAVLWLEDWLRAYPGTLLLISHDRDFLDRVTDHILHLEVKIDAALASLYTGNYSAFERARAANLAREQAAAEKQRREAAHMRDFVERFRAKASKARQAQSRLKMLERLPEITAAHVDSPFHFEFRASEKLPAPLLVIKDGSAGYPGAVVGAMDIGDTTILSKLKLSLSPGDRIGLIGPNGAGKSTLIRLLAGELVPRSGERIGARDLKIGYFAQHQLEQLHLDDTALTHLARLDPRAREQELRDFLGGFGFNGDRVLQPVAPFSGGEKARLVLAMIVYLRPNLLLLDEPTNHLDLEMRHALSLALQEFDGAMVIVSHDRYLLRSVTDRLILVADGLAETFDGDLDEDYPKWLAARRVRQIEPGTGMAPTTPNRKEQRRQEADKRRQIQPLRNRQKTLEQEMERLSAEKTRISAALADNSLYTGTDKAKLKSLLQEQGQIQQALTQAESAWLEVCESIETADHSDK